MKKILRTKLEYRCDKKKDFDYIERRYINTWSRSFDMVVTSTTKEDCERVMESFMKDISDADIQHYFESNIEPEFDKKKKLWVGAVEVYVGNDYVADEKEAIKEVYKDWKETIKNIEVKENKEMRKEIKVERIMETTYEDGTSWVEYTTPNGSLGYEVTEDYEEGDEKELEKEINDDEITYNGMIDKKYISVCSEYLAGIIEECRQSDNEMWYIEYEELQEELSVCKDEVDNFIVKLQDEVNRLDIQEYITFYEDGCVITVYGGVITKFLF